MDDKKSLHKTGIDPVPLAFKAGVNACFPGSVIEPMPPLAFQASGIATAPLVLHCTSTRS